VRGRVVPSVSVRPDALGPEMALWLIRVIWRGQRDPFVALEGAGPTPVAHPLIRRSPAAGPPPSFSALLPSFEPVRSFTAASLVYRGERSPSVERVAERASHQPPRTPPELFPRAAETAQEPLPG
jgi:hypothetical protein